VINAEQWQSLIVQLKLMVVWMLAIAWLALFQ
jgi:hypothetical protein